MNRSYLTKRRVAYYVVIAIAMLVAKTVAVTMFGEKGAIPAIIILMWLILVVDTKIAPSIISLSNPFLPGIGWIDLAVALLACSGLAWIGYRADLATSNGEFILVFLCAMSVCFVVGILGLIRWRRWRGLS